MVCSPPLLFVAAERCMCFVVVVLCRVCVRVCVFSSPSHSLAPLNLVPRKQEQERLALEQKIKEEEAARKAAEENEEDGSDVEE